MPDSLIVSFFARERGARRPRINQIPSIARDKFHRERFAKIGGSVITPDDKARRRPLCFVTSAVELQINANNSDTLSRRAFNEPETRLAPRPAPNRVRATRFREKGETMANNRRGRVA